MPSALLPSDGGTLRLTPEALDEKCQKIDIIALFVRGFSSLLSRTPQSEVSRALASVIRILLRISSGFAAVLDFS